MLRIDLGLEIDVYEELKKEDAMFKIGFSDKEIVAMSLMLFLRTVKSLSGTGIEPQDISFEGVENINKWLKENNILLDEDNRFILERLRIFLKRDEANVHILYFIIWDNIVKYFWTIEENEEDAYFTHLYMGFTELLNETLTFLVLKDVESIKAGEFFKNEKLLERTVKMLGLALEEQKNFGRTLGKFQRFLSQTSSDEAEILSYIDSAA